MTLLCTKSFAGANGFSCCFRDHTDQTSTLGQLHGAVLGFKIIFEADTLLDIKKVPEVLDHIEEFLEANFSHTTIVSNDDPSMEAFDQLDEDGAIDLILLPETTIEAFAKYVFCFADEWVTKAGTYGTLSVHSVECKEHEGSSAICARDDSVIEFVEDSATQEDKVPS